MIQSNISTELGHNFLLYAAAVNSDRAIPDAKTGLKPVHQRILFIMEDEGVSSSKPHRKSAKTVGSVMGRVHPHGDSSIYEAMVRLAQPWVMRYPLIDWHGNYGTQGGDGAAAQRYTESRLAKITEDGLLVNLKKNNVDWKPNYSEDEKEPVTLPAIFPNLLCNPNQGIGVAMACNWLPHNLTEVGKLIANYIENGTLDFTGFSPDFPTGGTIINGKDLASIYTTGKGSVILRGKYDIETRGNKTLLVFKEIPFSVKTEDLLEQINEACTKELITGVEEVRDESNKKGLRIVFELSKGASEGQTLKQIFKETDLQKTVSANQVALVDKTPKQLSWKEAIDIYIAHNIDVITRESKFDLEKALARIEIVNGLLKALEDIDNIIALIKKSKSSADAKENLIAQYKFTENQAKAIVAMKLGSLAGLERIELQQEHAELNEKISNLKTLISSDELLKKAVLDRLTAFYSKYGDKRRTEVTHIEIKPEEKEIAEVIPEDVIIVVSQSGSVKRIPSKSYKVQKKNGKGIKSQEDAVMDIIKTNTIDTLILFTSKGKMYRLLVDNIPAGTNVSRGIPISTLISLEKDEKIVAVTSLYRQTDAEYAMFITKQGMVKKTKVEEYLKTKRSTGIAALTLKDGDEISSITFLKDEDLILITNGGMSIRFVTKDIAPIGRVAMGVKGIKLNDGDYVIAGLPVHKETDHLAIFTQKGIGKKMELSEFPLQNRGGKGTIAYKPSPITGNIVAAAMVDNEDNILIMGNASTICISSTDIPLLSKTSIGNALIKNNIVTSVAKV